MADNPKVPPAIDPVKAFAENARDITTPKAEPEQAALALHPSIEALKSPTLVEQQTTKAPEREARPAQSKTSSKGKPPAPTYEMLTPDGARVRKAVQASQSNENKIMARPARANQYSSGKENPKLVISKDNVRNGDQGQLNEQFMQAKDRTIER